MKVHVSDTYSMKGHTHGDIYAPKSFVDKVLLNAPTLAVVERKLHNMSNPAYCLNNEVKFVRCDVAPTLSYDANLRRISTGDSCLTADSEITETLSFTPCTGSSSQQFLLTAGGEVVYSGPSASSIDKKRSLYSAEVSGKLSRGGNIGSGTRFTSDATFVKDALLAVSTGRFVRLTAPGDVQLSEIEIWSGGVNVAQGKTVTTSGEHAWYPAKNIVDGNKSTTFTGSRTDVWKPAWILIDTAAAYLITSIIVHNVSRAGNTLIGAQIEILNQNQEPMFRSEFFKNQYGTTSTSSVNTGFSSYEVKPPYSEVITFLRQE